MKRQSVIPSESKIYQELSEITENTKVVIFSGLPGVGKSLYVQEFQAIAEQKGKPIDVIQWDVARKSFETEYILSHFPMGEGIVHNGLKLIAGKWLMDTLKNWISTNKENSRILLIEAPLVGHRFVELIKHNSDAEIENYLATDNVKIVMPIPTKKVREAIEAARSRQVKEDAKVWSGAKPSVMLMLWKMTCEIANEFGMDIDLTRQPPYNASIYEYVFSEILKHRNFVPLIIDELFEIEEQDESVLHNTDSIHADIECADFVGKQIIENYNNDQIDEIVEKWYIT